MINRSIVLPSSPARWAENLDWNTAKLLRDVGYDALNARELGRCTIPDDQIFEYAVQHNRIIVTLDSKFHIMIVLRPLSAPSAVLLRVKNPHAVEACALIDTIRKRFEEQLLKGCIITVDADSARIRTLPINLSR